MNIYALINAIYKNYTFSRKKIGISFIFKIKWQRIVQI